MAKKQQHETNNSGRSRPSDKGRGQSSRLGIRGWSGWGARPLGPSGIHHWIKWWQTTRRWVETATVTRRIAITVLWNTDSGIASSSICETTVFEIHTRDMRTAPLNKAPIVDNSEFKQQDGRKKKKVNRLRVTNVTRLLRACFVVVFTNTSMFSGLLQKDLLKGK